MSYGSRIERTKGINCQENQEPSAALAEGRRCGEGGIRAAFDGNVNSREVVGMQCSAAHHAAFEMH